MTEATLINKIAVDYFKGYDCTELFDRIDFTVKGRSKVEGKALFEEKYLLWAEAKQSPTDVYKMLAQLILTIKKPIDNGVMPAKYLGCFDSEKIAFVSFYDVQPVFLINDFDWTQTPSGVDEKTISTVRKTVPSVQVRVFYYGKDERELREFIKANFTENDMPTLATRITRDNFIFVYQKWCKKVLPHIDVDLAEVKKRYGIYDRDFFLAEMNIDDNGTADIGDDRQTDKAYSMSFDASRGEPYVLRRKDAGDIFEKLAYFGYKSKKGLEAYADFWKIYKRPPVNEAWEYITERLDLLVPQDVRERKGAFFTPQIWVEKSQEYLAKVLGANWQDEYYVWDCCAGTGNLLNGLRNKRNIWASTLDQQDVDVMKERIRNGANLFEEHVFQFDFLNDSFDKLPEGLRGIIEDKEKRKRLVVYINPPYAEATNARTVAGTGENKPMVATGNNTYVKYKSLLGQAGKELFAQFFIRIYQEIQGCVLAEFSTLKILQAANFDGFRKVFRAKLEKIFVVPANTFDNVKGQFPIGFYIWNTAKPEYFERINADVFDKNGKSIGTKTIALNTQARINQWIVQTQQAGQPIVGYLYALGADFQSNNNISIQNETSNSHYSFTAISEGNLREVCIYLAVRQCIEATWLNDRDQFLYPSDGWERDVEFQNDCLAFTLFHGQNRISSEQGVNHWIPFGEGEVGSKRAFGSDFMVRYLKGRGFSEEARGVFDAGLGLWKYYFEQRPSNVDASLYDIRKFFQGVNERTGRMNNKSEDEEYNRLIGELRGKLKGLAFKVAVGVYRYGFLRM